MEKSFKTFQRGLVGHRQVLTFSEGEQRKLLVKATFSFLCEEETSVIIRIFFHQWSRLQAGSIKNMSEHLSPVWITPEEKPLMVYKWIPGSSVRRLKHLDRTLTHYSLPNLFHLFIKFSLSSADPRYKVTKLRNLNLPHRNRQNTF